MLTALTLYYIGYKFDLSNNSLRLESLINIISQVLKQRPEVSSNLPPYIMQVTIAFNSGPWAPGYVLPDVNKSCVSPISDFI